MPHLLRIGLWLFFSVNFATVWVAFIPRSRTLESLKPVFSELKVQPESERNNWPIHLEGDWSGLLCEVHRREKPLFLRPDAEEHGSLSLCQSVGSSCILHWALCLWAPPHGEGDYSSNSTAFHGLPVTKNKMMSTVGRLTTSWEKHTYEFSLSKEQTECFLNINSFQGPWRERRWFTFKFALWGGTSLKTRSCLFFLNSS